METEGNSLLELPLESSEILEEVNLTTNNVDVADAGVDNVGGMLIDESARSNISCMESNSIDFDFVHADLGNSTDFNIDHPSVFGMTDNVIDTQEDCEDIFRDSACFDQSNACVSKQTDAGTSLHSGFVTVPGFGKSNLYRDLGLKLQVIPLNNLQYVSTIQTSRGLHILAIPTQTSVSPSYDAVNVQQIGQKTKQCLGLDINQSLGGLTVKGMQSKLDEMTNLQANMVKNTELAEETVEKRQTFKISAKSSNRALIKGQKSTRKVRTAVERKFIISRKNALCKSNVHRIFNDRSIRKGRKKRTLYIDVVKTPSLRKRRMVSLLKGPATNKLKQFHNNITNRNSGFAKRNEIKLTFHLKPSLVDTNTTEDCLANAVIPFKDKAVPQANTEYFIKETEESFNRSCKDQYVTSETEKLRSPHSESKIDCEGVPDNHRRIKDNTKNLLEKPDKVLEIDQMSLLQKDIGKGYQCKICLSIFSRKGHFTNHLKTHSVKTSTVQVTGDKFEDYNEKGKHLNQFEPTTKSVKEKDNLDKAVISPTLSDSAKSRGRETKLWKCEFCVMEFKTKGNLTRHKLTHQLDMEKEVQGRYQCDECNKYFLQKCDLRRHVATHSGKYPYVCSVCDKGFIRRSDLTVHEKFHTQEKRYKCQVCSKAYYQTGDLSRHMRQNHSDLCEFACQDCGKKYTTQKTLNLHMKAKH